MSPPTSDDGSLRPPSGLAKGLERALGLEPLITEARWAPASSLLLNPRRLEIVLAAAAYPGVHLRSASRLLLSPLPSLRFHIERLEDEGLVRVRREGSRACLFLPGMFPLRMEPFLAAWADPFTRRVATMIWERPGIPRTILARQVVPIGRELEQCLRRLRAIRGIRAAGPRTDPAYSPTAAWREFERACRDGTGGRLQVFLTLLRQQGLHPVLEEMHADAARISVDGPRFRVRFSLPLNPMTRPTEA